MKNAALILLTTLFVACTNEIPFKGDGGDAVLIVNTLLDANAKSNRIIIAFTGRHTVTYVDDATVNIYVNDVLKESIPRASSEQGVYITTATFVPGDLVKVEALTSDGAHRAWAEECVPAPIAIEGLQAALFSTRYNDYYRIRTTFTDNGDSKSYYRISARTLIEVEGKSAITGNDTIISENFPQFLIAKEDVVLTDGRPTPIDKENDDIILSPTDNIYCVFDNSRIQGSYTMLTTAQIRAYYGEWKEDLLYTGITKERYYADIKLSAITPAMYLYLKALNIYDSDNYDDVLTQPIKLPSNVNGGTGIVGISCGITQSVFLYEDEIDWDRPIGN